MSPQADNQPMPSMDVMFQTAYRQIICDGTVDKMVREGVEKLVSRSIEQTLRYGPLAQSIQDQVEQSLKVANLDLPSYGETIANIVRQMVEKATADSIQRGVGQRIIELLDPPPESINVSDLIAQYAKYVGGKHSEGCSCGEAEEIGVRYNMEFGAHHLYLSEEPLKESDHWSAADIHIDVDRSGKIYSLHVRDRNVRDQLFTGRGIYDFERSLVQCYAANTKIIFDMDPLDCDRTITLDV